MRDKFNMAAGGTVALIVKLYVKYFCIINSYMLNHLRILELKFEEGRKARHRNPIIKQLTSFKGFDNY